MRLPINSLAIAFVLVSTAAYAGWQDHATPFDQQRLMQLDESRAKGLAEAGSGGDMAAIHEALDPAPAAISGNALMGDWRCRTIKLGGMAPSVVYSWFKCRISNRGSGLFLEKLTGTQRMNGYLYPDASGLVYLGATSTMHEPPHAYPGNGASAGAHATPDDQIGLLVASSANAARVEFPYPVQESTFDILELRR
jgi:Domain of unknown function (DUF4893)